MHSLLVLVDRPGRGTARKLARVNDRNIIDIDNLDGKRVYGVPWARLPLRESQLRPLLLPNRRTARLAGQRASSLSGRLGVARGCNGYRFRLRRRSAS